MLEFNKHVLALAQDPSIPLLERLRFLCITCTNLDEFFEIRVAALKQRIEIGALAQGPEQLPAQQVFDILRHQMMNVVSQQYELLNNVMFPELAKAGVRFVRSEDWTDEQEEWLREYFEEQVVPVLTPLTFDPSRPFPRLLNKSLNFIVRLKGRDAYGRRRHRGMVQAPRSLPRIIRLPEHLSVPGSHDFVFLSSVIRVHVETLFPGLKVEGCYQFRVTRNSNLYVDEEEVSDLVGVLEGQLEASRYGAAVRIEVGHECPPDLQQFLLDHFGLQEQDMYLVDGPVNLNRLATVCEIDNRPELLYKPFTQGVPEELVAGHDIFSILSKKNVLLYHPYQGFGPVIDFINGAAKDPDVLAIKITGSPRHRRTCRQRGNRHHRIDGAIRRSSKHLPRKPAAGSRRACGLRPGGLQDTRENGAGRTSREREAGPLCAPRHRQLPSQHDADLYRLRSDERRSQARRGRAQGIHAAHEPDRSARSEPVADIAVQPF
jgi:polyphosphate kinase